jgi:putative ABC transport system permease protein
MIIKELVKQIPSFAYIRLQACECLAALDFPCLMCVLKDARIFTLQGMFLHITFCIGASASLFICYTLLLVVRTHPWWQAQYFIPILGMLLGNAISGVSVGLSTILDEFVSGVPG